MSKASKQRVEEYFARFDGEGEQQPQDASGELVTLTAGELEGIVSKAVKKALKAEDDRKRELADESIGAKIAREHCERMNG